MEEGIGIGRVKRRGRVRERQLAIHTYIHTYIHTGSGVP